MIHLSKREKKNFVFYIIVLIIMVVSLLIAVTDGETRFFKHFSHSKLGEPMTVSTEKPCYIEKYDRAGDLTFQLWTVGPNENGLTYIGSWVLSNGQCIYKVFIAEKFTKGSMGCTEPIGTFTGTYDCDKVNKYFNSEKKKAGVTDEPK